MNWLIDTCVWSLALRRTIQPHSPEMQAFHEALMGEGLVFTTPVASTASRSVRWMRC